MATDRKSADADQGLSWADSTDEDVPPPQTTPSLEQVLYAFSGEVKMLTSAK